jgi:glycosyltransferase involved in cell wall biosynthesis
LASRPRLLFLCQTVPYPPDGGVWIRTFNILRLLARRFDLTLLCFERSISPADGFSYDENASIETLRGYGRVEVFRIPQRHSRARFVRDHVSSLLTQRVFTRYLYESDAFRQRLVQLLASEHFDLVHMDSLDLSGYLPLLRGQRVICTHHNVESRLLQRRGKIESSIARRAYSSIQARFMEAEERTWVPQVELNITVSDEDRVTLQSIAPGARCAVVPNGVDVTFFQPAETTVEGPRLVFVGGANWFPNRDALVHFCHDILPLIRRDEPAVTIDWVGACSERDQREFAEKFSVNLTGYVDDIRPYVAAAACYVVPIRVGGGSRLKIVDAWAMGKALVTTSIGCEGLKAQHGVNALIADTAEAFAEATVRVLRDNRLRASLGMGARQTAESVYSWDAIAQSMFELYDRAMAGP